MLAVCAATACAIPAQAGLVFNITYTAAVQGDANFADIQTAVNFVKNEFSSTYSDNVTLDFTIDSNTSGLGQSLFSTNYFRGDYTTLRNALIADAMSADDATATAVANLPVADPYNAGLTGWFATSAEAKALGLAVGNTALDGDGTYTFNRNQTYTYDPLNRQVVGKFDFIGVTEHEFSELMGRTNQLNNPGFGFDALDTMRFTGVGARSITVSTPNVYFSFDNGNTNLKGYNAGPPGDSQDWDSSDATDPYNAGTSSNQGHSISAVDVRALDVIGWDLATTVPEPSLLIPAACALGLIYFKRRRRLA